MRVRGVLGFAFGLAAAGALVACGGGQPAGHPYTQAHGSRNQDIYISLDSTCTQQLKAEPNVAFSDKDVTWHIIGECNQDGKNLTLAFTDNILQSCQSNCSVKISGTGATIKAHINPNTPPFTWYQYTLQFGTVTIDPYLEIDP